jgi:radical SAM protein with 4Fe4S-binding SPASM domain
MRKWNIGWGTISRCNMKCQFCYSEHKRKQSNDLSYENWVKFIDENHGHIGTINYGTGENTISDDWFRLVEYIRKKYPEIRQALTTNGYLSEAIKRGENLKIFRDAIDEVDVSLDFADAEKHGNLRGQPAAWKWAINTLELCQNHNKLATIVFLGSQKNLYKENIDGIFSIAKKYNAILRMNMYRPTRGLDELSRGFIASYDDIATTLKYINDQYNILSLNDAFFSTILTGETICDPSGDKSIRILADGSITPSTYLIEDGYIVGNICETNVLMKLEQTKALEKIICKIIPNECKECVYCNSCEGGVYDRRYLWYGTLEHKDPYCPRVYKKVNDDILRISKQNFTSVHDGYLPTMFFKP